MPVTESLIIELNAKIDKYQKDIRSAQAQTEKFQKSTQQSFNRIEQSAKKSESTLKGFNFSLVAIGVSAGILARQTILLSDKVQLAENQLKAVTSSTQEYTEVLAELDNIAITTRQDVNELIGVYSRFARASSEMELSTRDLIDFTETLTKTLKIEGNTAAEVNSVMVQLSQAFRSGRIQGEEFRALSEASTISLKALSKATGVAVGDLKDLAAQGKVTPEDLITGFKMMGSEITSEFKNLEPTFSEIWTVIGNISAAAYRDSFLDKGLSSLKQDTLDLLKDIQTAVTGTEQSSIEDIDRRIKELQDALSDDGLFSGLTGWFTDIEFEIDRLKKRRDELLAERGDTTTQVVEVEEKRKPIVNLTSSQERMAEQAERRLKMIEDQASAEAQLITAVEEGVITEREARAAQARQREMDSLTEFYTQKIEAVGVNAQMVEELELAVSEGRIQKITEDEQKILDIKKQYIEAEIALKEKQAAREKQIRDAKNRGDVLATISAGSRLLSAISKTSKEGTKMQEIAAKGSIVANTAAGIMRQYKDLPEPMASISAAAIALEGAAALSSVGSGSAPTAKGGGATQVSTLPTTPPPTEDTGERVEVSINDTLEMDQHKIIISTEDGEDIFDGISRGVERSRTDGRT